MSKKAYILEHFGETIGVIVAENDGQLMARTVGAIKENISEDIDEDGCGGQFECHMKPFVNGNSWLMVKYVNDGSLIKDGEFMLKETKLYE